MKNFVIVLGVVLLGILLIQQTDAVSHHKPTDIIQSVCVGKAGVTRAQHEKNLASWKNCRFQREELVPWVQKLFPQNTLGLSMENCTSVRNKFLKGPELAVMETCETVFIRCDCNKDGIIDEEDLLNTSDYCIKDCKAANRLFFAIGDRIVDMNDPFGATKDPEAVDPDSIADD